MAEKFLMPKLSPTMEEGQISRWLKNEGEKFDANETLAEVDTDKATMEMTALSGGTLLKIIKGAGETAALGEPIAITGKEGEDISALLAEIGSGEKPKGEQPKAEEKPEDNGSEPGESSPPARGGVAAASADGVVGVATGSPDKEEQPKAQPATAAEGAPSNGGSANGRMIVSPIAARMAAENGIDLKTVQGSGPGGRIIKRDIEAAMSRPSAVSGEQKKAEYKTIEVQGASSYHEENISKMRSVIAHRLTEATQTIPMFYLTVEIEMDNVLALRKQMNAVVGEEHKVSVNDIIVKAAAMSLIKHPWVNASFQDKTIKFYEDADIGVAVAIEDGLITPVIRGANKKGIAQISAEIKEMAGRAREKKLQPEEYTGATFSISNLGMFGIEQFTAIINPPEAAIVAIGGARETAVVRDGQVTVKNIMKVTMSCDHRVVDGATGAKFLQTLTQMLENPAMMLL
ncbi:MAG TPA: pyruvate dehydrogenase complex dihydrolipoamide acetyltransferase [Pyrinomonadaceae bacterium]|jgi:pyruvate dehydrogenase E2 component (dihydrolipoamide acetyltransferase)|nr:pyruvate dehydrogenase complex dihydrolipoamide acetyltransferase [Pyrinomonadaceae bacterium]